MNRWKYWTAGVLGIAAILSLAAFAWQRQTENSNAAGNGQNVVQQENGGAEKQVAAALERLEQVKSLETVMDIDLGISIFGLEAEAGAEAELVSFRDPLKGRAQASLDLSLLGDAQAEGYITEGRADSCLLYLKNDKGWQCEELPLSAGESFSGNLMKLFMEEGTDWKAEGQDTLAGGKAYRYQAVLHKDGLKKVVEEIAGNPLTEQLLNRKELSFLRKLLEQNAEELPTMLDTAADLKLILWIDTATGYPVQCRLDLGSMLNDGLKMLLANASGVKSFLTRLEITEAQITVNCGSFNNAEEFSIPDEALAVARGGSSNN